MVLGVIREVLLFRFHVVNLIDVGQGQVVLLGLGRGLGMRIPILALVQHVKAFFRLPLCLNLSLFDRGRFDLIRQGEGCLEVVLAVSVVVLAV